MHATRVEQMHVREWEGTLAVETSVCMKDERRGKRVSVACVGQSVGQ